MEHIVLILNLITEGLRPSKIAKTHGLPTTQVVQTIINAIQERRIRRLQVFDSLEPQWQNEMAVWFSTWEKKKNSKFAAKLIHEQMKQSNLEDFDLEIEEVELYLLCLERGFKDGEMYEAICEIERTLHSKIKHVLVQNFGERESGWWKKGVPLRVREYCVVLREKDDDWTCPMPYQFTTLGQLREILMAAKNSALFKKRLPLAHNGKEPNMDGLFTDLERLAKIRNRVMHPVGTVMLDEDDFFLQKECKRS